MPGGKYQVWHGDKTYTKYKVDENGNVVETTELERQKEMMVRQLIVITFPKKSRLIITRKL